MKKIISFDVSKKTINVYNSIEDKSSKITNTYKDITDLVTKYQDYVFVYEATGIYSSTLLKACNDLQVKHYFIHPNDSSQLFSSLFCKSNKTDELDAKQLAQLAELLMLQESQLGKSKFIKPNSNQIAILRSYMSQIRFYKETIKLFNQRLEKL
jgi:transposase